MDSMTFYADLVREKTGNDKVELFCDCVDSMNLMGADIKRFAKMCGFAEANVYQFKQKSLIKRK